MKFEKGKKYYRLLSKGGFTKAIIGKCYEASEYKDSKGLELNIDGEDLYFFFKEVEEVINDKPERYKSREVHGLDVIDLVNYWGLNFQEGNILKYLLRDKGEDESDLEKIIDYAQRELKRLRDCK